MESQKPAYLELARKRGKALAESRVMLNTAAELLLRMSVKIISLMPEDWQDHELANNGAAMAHTIHRWLEDEVES